MAWDMILAVDITDALGRTADPDQKAWLDTLIRQAERRLRRHIPNLDTLSAAPDTAAFIRDVIIAAVARVVRNPKVSEGYSSESEGSYSYSVASALTASAAIWFPDSDLALLRPRRSPVGTIRVKPRMP